MSYVFKWVDQKEFDQYTGKLIHKIFDPSTIYLPSALYSPSERAKIKKLKAQFDGRVRLYLVALSNGKVAGWSFGEQTRTPVFHMQNSAVMPAHRRKKLYSKILQKVLKKTKEMGFQVVKSYHRLSNNAVLISKLKAGFVFTGMELDDVMGPLVELGYFHNSGRKAVFDYRVSDKKLPKQIRKKYPRNQI